MAINNELWVAQQILETEAADFHTQVYISKTGGMGGCVTLLHLQPNFTAATLPILVSDIDKHYGKLFSTALSERQAGNGYQLVIDLDKVDPLAFLQSLDSRIETADDLKMKNLFTRTKADNQTYSTVLESLQELDGNLPVIDNDVIQELFEATQSNSEVYSYVLTILQALEPSVQAVDESTMTHLMNVRHDRDAYNAVLKLHLWMSNLRKATFNSSPLFLATQQLYQKALAGELQRLMESSTLSEAQARRKHSSIIFANDTEALAKINKNRGMWIRQELKRLRLDE